MSIPVCHDASEKYPHLETSRNSEKNNSQEEDSRRQPQKVLKYKHLFSYVVSLLIGSGIFISPSLIARHTNNMGVALLIWIVSGILCIFGALCFCELAVALQKSGGPYIFIKESYGEMAGFFAIWSQLLVAFPADISVLAIAIGEYIAGTFVKIASPNGIWIVKAIAIFSIFISVALNMVSTSFVSNSQMFFTMIQAVCLTFVIAVGIWNVGTGDTKNFIDMFENSPEYTKNYSSLFENRNSTVDRSSSSELGSLGLAFYSGLYAYDGWGIICTVSEEICNLERDLRLSVITGIPFVMIFYVFINLALMSKLTHKEIANSATVVTKFIEKSLGRKVAFMIPVSAALICFACLNAGVFVTSRALMSAGKEGHLPGPLSYIHKGRRTPVPSLVLTFCVTVIWTFSLGDGTMKLVSYFSFASWILYGMAIFAVIILRVQKPDLQRPFKVWLLNPIMMTMIALFLVVVPFLKSPLESSVCVGLLLISIPVYFVKTSKRNSTPDSVRKAKQWFYLFLRQRFNLQ